MDPLRSAGAFAAAPDVSAFNEPTAFLRALLLLLAAALAGAVLAHHPVYRGRPAKLEDLEQKKTVIVYAVVGALAAVVCAAYPAMAFVIFGIGGLLRFRTDVGASKGTGHTIVATLIGLCFGLDLVPIAVLATAFFWVLVYVLELARTQELIVGGIAVADMQRAAEAYRQALARAGCRVLGHHKAFKKSQMTFVFRLPREGLERVSKEVDAIEEPLKGTPDWPE